MESRDLDVVEMAQHPFFQRVLGKYGQKPRRAAFRMNEDGCFEWQGAVNSKGYPTDGGGLLHRQAWELFVGEIAPDCDVHHTCKNRLCSRISHLAVLSHAEHAMLERRCSLTEWQVVDMLKRLMTGERTVDVAALFNVSPSHVSKIKTAKRWSHIAVPFLNAWLAVHEGVSDANLAGAS